MFGVEVHCGDTRFVVRALAAVAVVSGAVLGVGFTAPQQAVAQLPACLWAGDSFGPGDTVFAGGWAFSCAPDGSRWDRGARAPGHVSTVSNPGARDYPAAGFSIGALQPGTSFFDFCEGDNAVLPGTDYVFEAVAFEGGVFWKAAGAIDQWTFDPGTSPAQYTYGPPHECVNGVLS